MKKYIIILTAFLFIFSCSDDEKPNDADMLKGKYNLVALTSDISLDLNHDGTASTDMLQELDFAYSNGNFPSKILKVKESLSFYGSVLTANFYPQFNDYDISYTPLPFSGRIFKYNRDINVLEYEANPPSFVHIPLFPEDIDTRTAPIVTNMEILPDMKIKVTMLHRYTETPENYPDCWTNIVLTAVYEKYTDNPD
ncbi:MAG: hypothetical protein LBE36_03575 [Flavobacteriaceae bacterium]|nr:hypothetical protein [Flavobacteriaceae bacterium]